MRLLQQVPALVCFVGIFALTACTQEPSEQALRQTVAAMQSAIESGDASDFLDYVAEDFSGQNGALDKSQLRALIMTGILRHKHIGVASGPIKVKIFDDRYRATLHFQALLTGGEWLPENGQVLDIESHWRYGKGDWKCFSATWTARW